MGRIRIILLVLVLAIAGSALPTAPSMAKGEPCHMMTPMDGRHSAHAPANGPTATCEICCAGCLAATPAAAPPMTERLQTASVVHTSPPTLLPSGRNPGPEPMPPRLRS